MQVHQVEAKGTAKTHPNPIKQRELPAAAAAKSCAADIIGQLPSITLRACLQILQQPLVPGHLTHLDEYTGLLKKQNAELVIAGHSACDTSMVDCYCKPAMQQWKKGDVMTTRKQHTHQLHA